MRCEDKTTDSVFQGVVHSWLEKTPWESENRPGAAPGLSLLRLCFFSPPVTVRVDTVLPSFVKPLGSVVAETLRKARGGFGEQMTLMGFPCDRKERLPGLEPALLQSAEGGLLTRPTLSVRNQRLREVTDLDKVAQH